MTQRKAQKSRGGKKKRQIARPPSDRVEENTSTSHTLSSKVPKHKHCNNCGVSIAPEKETCSEECQVRWDKMLSRKKFWTYLPIIGTILIVLFWILVANG